MINKNTFILLVSTILVLIGWFISIFTYKYFGKTNSIILRVMYGLVITSIANFFIDNDYEKIKNINDFFDKYKNFYLISISTMISGWLISIIIYNYFGYIPSFVIRILYGILSTYLIIKYVKTD